MSIPRTAGATEQLHQVLGSSLAATTEAERSGSEGISGLAARTRLLALPALVVVAGALIVFSRRPDAFIHPQFWAEDGKFWYATAYNHGGLAVLFDPHTGYLQVLARATAMVSTGLPLAWAPTIFVVVAVTVQVAPAGFLVSNRCEDLVSSRALRVLLAFLYLGIPNSFEVDANLTNAQWHLALLALLVVVARPPRGAGGRALDAGVLVLCGLSGPFAILLVPVACIVLAVRRRRWTAISTGVLAATGIAQIVMLLTSPRGSPGALGASAAGFFSIVGRQVFLGATVGQWGLEHVSLVSSSSAYAIAVGALGIAFVLVAALRVRAEVLVVALFGTIVLVASLASPTSTHPIKDWVALGTAGVGGRYWLIPMFALFVLVVGVLDARLTAVGGRIRSLLHSRAREDGGRVRALWKWASIPGAMLVLVVALAVGVPRDWRYPPFENYHFARYAAIVDHAQPGRRVRIPINPPGWTMTLVKRR